MILFKNIIRPFLFIAIFCIAFSYCNAQKVAKPIKDTTESIGQDTLVSYIVKKVEGYSFKIKKDRSTIKRNIKISPIESALPPISKALDVFNKRLNAKGKPMNMRGLNTSGIILKEKSDLLLSFQMTLSEYLDTLIKDNSAIKNIQNDALLQTNVSDTSLSHQMLTILQNAKQLDSTQKSILRRITVLHNKVSVLLLRTNDISSEIRYQTAVVKIKMWRQDDEQIFKDKSSEYNQSLWETTLHSLTINKKVLAIYLSNKWDIISLGILLFILITTWCYSNVKRVQKNEYANKIFEQSKFLKRSVIFSCLMAFFTVFPLFFNNPQMSFLHFCELLRLIALSYLLYPFLSKSYKPIWLIFCVLWIYFAIDDLMLDAAFGERWCLLFMDIAFIIICIKLVKNVKGIFIEIAESPATKPLTIFCMTLSFLSLIFNLSGRVTLAKILGITAIQCMFLGITLKVFSTMVIEAIYLQSEAYQESRFSEFINFKVLQNKLKKILWVVAIIIWIIALLIDFDLYSIEKGIFYQFLNTDRSIGNMRFTYESVVIFVGIIWLSSFISGFINFFFGHEKSTGTIKKSNIGSMMLLVRLAIWAIGFIVAIAAAGIPLDKITIMLGALSVGIGFGLQNITNNLVSGIILAFERPIQIGDHIEVGNKAGIVNEIGVRSSKIRSLDGSDIIVPNGDLLSQHLINWTKQDRRKRLNFVIGVGYDSNLHQVKSIIQNAVETNIDVLKELPPTVLVQSFADSAIEISIYFWVADLATAAAIKTNVMIGVFEALNQNKIVIPYPIVTIVQDNEK